MWTWICGFDFFCLFQQVSAIFATLHWVNSQLLPAGCRFIFSRICESITFHHDKSAVEEVSCFTLSSHCDEIEVSGWIWLLRWMEAVTAGWWNEISFRSHLSLPNYFDSDTLCCCHGGAQVRGEPPCSSALDLFSQCQLLPKLRVSGGPNGWDEPREATPFTEDVGR